MMNSKIFVSVLLSCLLPSLVCLSSARADSSDSDALGDADTMDYDAIVNELSKPLAPVHPKKDRTRASSFSSSDAFDNSMIHLGVGYSNLFETLVNPDGFKSYLNQPGVQVSLGIDLLSEHFFAEGDFSSYGEQDYDHGNVTLKEFDLKFYYKTMVAPKVSFKVGTGIAARYMDIVGGVDSHDANGNIVKDGHGNPILTAGNSQYTTPSSIFTAGIDTYVSDTFSFGGELAMESTMVGDTPDQRSLSAIFRIDSHF